MASDAAHQRWHTINRPTRRGDPPSTLAVGGVELVERGLARYDESAIVDLGRATPAQYLDHVFPVMLDMAQEVAEPDWRDDGRQRIDCGT